MPIYGLLSLLKIVNLSFENMISMSAILSNILGRRNPTTTPDSLPLSHRKRGLGASFGARDIELALKTDCNHLSKATQPLLSDQFSKNTKSFQAKSTLILFGTSHKRPRLESDTASPRRPVFQKYQKFPSQIYIDIIWNLL